MVTSSQAEAERAAAQQDTDLWFFRGGTGADFRAVTLPRFVENARRGQQQGLTVTVELPDPDNVELCGRYARTLSRPPAVLPGAEPWTANRVQRDLYATLLAVCWYREQYDWLEIRLTLASVYHSERFDISRDVAVLTVDDRAFPCHLIRRHSSLYGHYRNQLRESFDQGREVPLRLGRGVLSAAPSAAEVGTLFRALGLPGGALFAADDLADVIRKAGIHVLEPSP